MSTGLPRSLLRIRYEEAAEAYLRSLPLEHFMEATSQGRQREITMESLALVHADRPEVQYFNELLVQYPHGRRQQIRQVVPDNMIVVHDEPIKASGSFDVPFGRGRRFLASPQNFGEKILNRIAGGWTMAGTALYRGGTPLAIAGTDRLWWDAGQAGNGASERPVWVNRNYDPGVDGHKSLEGSAGYTPYINSGAFRKAQALPNLLEIGDLGTVIPLRGPGFFDMGFSLIKNFTLWKEGRVLQVRGEAENFLNTMNPGNPGSDITRPVSFGKITGQSGNPRRIMLSAKITF